MLLRFVLATAVCAFAAAPAAAGDVRLTIANGRVTLIARDATVREILAEWSRIGQTRIVNGEKIVGGPVTLELHDVTEAQALDTILRSASGYVLAPRPAEAPGPSVYDRIMILATSRPPAVSASPAPYTRPAPQQQAFQPPQAEENDDDDVNPIPGFAPANNNGINGVNGSPQQQQQMMQGPAPSPMMNQPRNAPPVSAPRPGMLPQPPVQNVPAPNPYAPQQPPGMAPNVPTSSPTPGPLTRPGGPGGGPGGD